MQRNGALPVVRLIGISTICFFGCVALACHGSTPSDSEARALLTQLDYYLDDGKTELSSFRKTNGVGGEGYYEYRYEATLICRKDINFGWGPKPDGQCHPGKVITLTGTLTLRRTEKGWERM
jgi:hypothetical protein